MGNIFSKYSIRKCNYHCRICRETNQLPNLAGKFIHLNTNDYGCDACHAVYTREELRAIGLFR